MKSSPNRDSQGVEKPAKAIELTIESFRRVVAPFRGPRRFRLDENECVLDRWLHEFQDQSTGCTSPPPMH